MFACVTTSNVACMQETLYLLRLDDRVYLLVGVNRDGQSTLQKEHG
jgi:hypothetical protein